MRPFFLNAGSDFVAPPPPTFDSPAFRETLSEVRTISDHRTNEQVRIAQYWEDLSGSFGAGHWNDVARGAISGYGDGSFRPGATITVSSTVRYCAGATWR